MEEKKKPNLVIKTKLGDKEFITTLGHQIVEATRDTCVEIKADKINLNLSHEKNGINRIFYGKEKPTTAVEGDCWFKNGELLIFKNDWESCVDIN